MTDRKKYPKLSYMFLKFVSWSCHVCVQLYFLGLKEGCFPLQRNHGNAPERRCVPFSQPFRRRPRSPAFKELNRRCGQERWRGSLGQQADYKMMSEEFLQIPHRSKEARYPEALALNTSPTPGADTTSSAGSCQAKGFFTTEAPRFFISSSSISPRVP